MIRFCAGSVALLALGASAVSASPVYFYGVDNGVGPGGARPNADAARASWTGGASSLGSIQNINFEMANNGLLSAVALDSNTTLTRNGGDNDFSRIINASGTVVEGYNTTAGGTGFLQGGTVFGLGNFVEYTFAYSSPISAWGAFFTGVGTVAGELTFNFEAGGSHNTVIGGTPGGGVLFYGFTYEGQSISSIEIRMTNTTVDFRDIFGIDDVGYVLADGPIIPLPSAGLLALGGMIMVGGIRRRS